MPRKGINYGQCVGKCSCDGHFSFGPHLIKEVLFYKYLGLELDHCLSFKMFKERVLARARASMARAWGMGIRTGYLSVKSSISLWQAVVRSTLDYGSQIWGKEKWLEGEQVQANIAIRILRCSSMTTREAMYGELGWWTLQSRRNFNKLMYWFHVVTMDDSRLVKKVYIVTQRIGKDTSWARIVKGILGKYGLDYLWEDQKRVLDLDGKGNGEAKTLSDHKAFFKKFIRSRIQEQEQKVWLNSMKGDDVSQRKLRTYVTFKKKLCLEKYLLADSDWKGRSYHTSLRTGTNVLEIDKGRYEGIHRTLRFCKQCELKVVEDEKHFVLQCPLYKQLRANLFKSILTISGGKWDLVNRPMEESFVLLMQGTGDEHEKIIFRIFHCHLQRCLNLE